MDEKNSDDEGAAEKKNEGNYINQPRRAGGQRPPNPRGAISRLPPRVRLHLPAEFPRRVRDRSDGAAQPSIRTLPLALQ